MTEHTLSRKEFDILTFLLQSDTEKTQREIAAATGMSVGTVNKILSLLADRELLKSNTVTTAGVEALEPYRAKRAVILAAGFGSRLIPITLNTPKPLVRINGKRLIDSLLDAILAAGIEDIVIVRGYLSEQFDQLLYKYPMIKFVENPMYNEANNISSAMCIRYMLSNTYIFEADLLLSNPAIIRKYQYTSKFLGIPRDRTDDWCLTVKNGAINDLKIGGINCYQGVGISYWNAADGAKLAEHLKLAYETPGGKEYFWDQTPFCVFRDAYAVEIQECRQEDVIEIDTFRELKAIDKSYDV